MSPEEDRTRDAVDSEPKHYQLSYSSPIITFYYHYQYYHYYCYDDDDENQRLI